MKRGSIFIVSLLMLVGVIILLSLIGKLGINGYASYDGKAEGKVENLALQKGITGNSVLGDLENWFEKLFGVAQFSPVNTSNSYFDDYADNITLNSGINQSSIQNVVWDGSSAYKPVVGTASEVASDGNIVLLAHLNGNVNDSSGNGNNGIIMNNTSCSAIGGKFNGVCVFDGYFDSINFGPNVVKSNQTSFSISAWVKNSQIGAPSQIKYIIIEGGSGIYLRWSLSMNYEFFVYDTGTVSWTRSNTGVVSDNNWHHLVGVFETGQTTKLYFDGQLQTPGGIPTGGLLQQANFYLGYPDIYAWNGTIDEVVVYNKSLTQNEVNTLYANGGGAISGSFKSKPIDLGGTYNSVIGKWNESVNGVTSINISSNGISWCVLQNDVQVTEATCNQLPSSSLIYRSSFNADTNLDNINLTWQSVSCTDVDGDRYSTLGGGSCCVGGCLLGVDCFDNNASIHPNAAEICGNGIDEDCSGGDLVCIPPNTIYVDQNPGTDCINNYSLVSRSCLGSPTGATSYNNIQKATDIILAGDTVLVRGGMYYPADAPNGCFATFECGSVMEIRNKSGTPNSWITIKAYQQPDGKYERVILNGSLIDRNAVVWVMRGSSYIIIDGFEVTGVPRQPIYNPSGCDLLGLVPPQCNFTSYGREIKGFFLGESSGISQGAVHDIIVKNSIVFDTAVLGSSVGGVVVGFDPSYNIMFDRNWARNTGAGFFIGSPHQSNMSQLPYNVTIKYSLATDITFGGGNSNGFIFMGARDSLVSHSVAYNISDTGAGSQGPWTDNDIFEYNVIYGMRPNHNPFLKAGPEAGNSRGIQVQNVNGGYLYGYRYNGSSCNNESHLTGGNNTIVRYNVIFDIGDGNSASENGITSPDGSQNESIYNNVIFDVSSWGILTDADVQRAIPDNCGQQRVSAVTIGSTLMNNIAHMNAIRPRDYRYQGVTENRLSNVSINVADYNLWSDLGNYSYFINNRITSYFSDGVIEPHTVTGDPLFTNQSNIVVDRNLWTGDYAYRIPNPNFGYDGLQGLQLKAGSPAIDNGTIILGFHCPRADDNSTNPYPSEDSSCRHWYGSAPDIGAYEFNPSQTGCITRTALNTEIQKFVNTQIGIVDVTNKVGGYLGNPC